MALPGTPRFRSTLRRDASRGRSAVVVLLLQALLWMAGPTIEARAEARSAGASAHIEERGTSTCPPIHSHLECQVCRTLRGGATPTASLALPTVATRVTRGAAPRLALAPRPTASGPLGSRAPPT